MAVVRKRIGNATYLYSVYQGEWRYLGKEKPIEEWLNRVHCGNAFELLPFMPSESVDCVITSPPFYRLRNYGEQAETVFGGNPSCEHEWVEERMTLEHENRNFQRGTQEEVHGSRPTIYIKKYDDRQAGFCVKCGAWRGQLGLEPSWRMYVDHLVELFREVKRVLKKTGSLWLNIGDKMYGFKSPSKNVEGYQPKCLMGVPWRVAFALIDDGWILRNAVIWWKPNAMPSSVKDRLAQTYEYLFHFVKSRRYYYCLSEDTEIYIRVNGYVKLASLLEVWKLFRSGTRIQILTPWGWRKLLEIWESHPEKVFEIRAGHIATILASSEHRFPVSQRSHSFSLKTPPEIVGKDRDYLLWIPIGRFLNEPKIKYIDLRTLGARDINGFAFLKRKRKYRIPTALQLDYDVGYLIGLWLAEGNIRGTCVRYALRQGEKPLQRLNEILQKYNIHLTVSKLQGRGVQAVFSNPLLPKIIRFFTHGDNAHNKGINREIILNTPSEFRGGILDGILDGDGSSLPSFNKCLCIASKQLRDDVALLASSLSIEFSKYEYKSYFGVRIFKYGKYVGRGRKPYLITHQSNGKPSSNQNTVRKITPFEAYVVNSKISEVKTEKRFFDLNVEGGLFLINGGIVTHNCLDNVREPHSLGTFKRIFQKGVLQQKGGLKQIELRGRKRSPGDRGSRCADMVKSLAEKYAKHDLAVGRIGNFSYTDPLHAKEYHPLGKNPGDVLTYDSKYAKHEYGQTLQSFIRAQSLAKRRQLSRIEAEILFPDDPKKQQEYVNYVHDHDGHPQGKNPGDVFTVPRNSKFLEADVETASPAARALKTVLSGKLTTEVKKKILGVGAYLKAKLRESGLSFKELSELTGVKQTTLEHYFRTDFSGQALPDRETWGVLKPILKLGEYDDFISEEIRSALPQPHPLGRNPGDFFSIATRPYPEAHFAVFPPELPLRPILASCPPDGVVLDPLAGSGTVAFTCELINHGEWGYFRLYVNEAAKSVKWNLKWILMEINPKFCDLAKKRLEPYVAQKSLLEFA